MRSLLLSKRNVPRVHRVQASQFGSGLIVSPRSGPGGFVCPLKLSMAGRLVVKQHKVVDPSVARLLSEPLDLGLNLGRYWLMHISAQKWLKRRPHMPAGGLYQGVMVTRRCVKFGRTSGNS